MQAAQAEQERGEGAETEDHSHPKVAAEESLERQEIELEGTALNFEHHRQG